MMKAGHFMMALALAALGAGCSSEDSGSDEASGAPVAAAAAAIDGEIVFMRCVACHAIEPGAPAKVGPNLAGVFGREAGSVEGFAYSDPLKNSGLVWTREELDRFIEHPMQVVPGTSMGFAGIPDDAQRAAVIDYIEAQGSGKTE